MARVSRSARRGAVAGQRHSVAVETDESRAVVVVGDAHDALRRQPGGRRGAVVGRQRHPVSDGGTTGDVVAAVDAVARRRAVRAGAGGRDPAREVGDGAPRGHVHGGEQRLRVGGQGGGREDGAGGRLRVASAAVAARGGVDAERGRRDGRRDGPDGRRAAVAATVAVRGRRRDGDAVETCQRRR